MKFKFITLSDPYYYDERMLRWEAIEKPKGLAPGSEKCEEEGKSFHLIALEAKQLVGCVLCYPESKTHGKIFHLALSNEYKGKPFGRQMFARLEEFLSEKGFSDVHVLAKEESTDFYSLLGFHFEGEPFEEYGEVYHRMEKTLLASA